MATPPPPPPAARDGASLRERSREALRSEIADQALVLLDERGFDETTVDDIAAAVGISARTFFRYFATKEDLVVGDPARPGVTVRDALAARPADEPPWVALRAAFEPLVITTDRDAARSLRIMRVMLSTAGLRARSLEKHLLWAQLLHPVMAARLGLAPDADDLPARSLVAGAITCFDVALARWTQDEGAESLGTILDRVVGTVSGASGTSGTSGTSGAG